MTIVVTPDMREEVYNAIRNVCETSVKYSNPKDRSTFIEYNELLVTRLMHAALIAALKD